MYIDIPPAHYFAKFNHSGRKTLRRLCQHLDSSAWHIVLARNRVDGHLIAYVSKLES